MRCPRVAFVAILVIAIIAAVVAVIWVAVSHRGRVPTQPPVCEPMTTTTSTTFPPTTTTRKTSRDDGPVIGWHASGEHVGCGNWCEASVPAQGWALHACGSDAVSHLQVKVLTYNLFWWNLFELKHGDGGISGKLIEDHSFPMPFDFMGFQECEDVDRVLSDTCMPGVYRGISGSHSLAIAYRPEAWALLSHGQTSVAEDRPEQWYGNRDLIWGRFRHRRTDQTVFFANFHGALPTNTGGLCGGAATAYNILQVIADQAHTHDAIILLGDFNADSKSTLVLDLSSRIDLSYTGQSFGGVDHMFLSCGAASAVKTENLGPGGSDHDALSAVLQI